MTPSGTDPKLNSATQSGAEESHALSEVGVPLGRTAKGEAMRFLLKGHRALLVSFATATAFGATSYEQRDTTPLREAFSASQS